MKAIKKKYFIPGFVICCFAAFVLYAKTNTPNNSADQSGEPFAGFILEFAHTPEFQKERIKFPIQYTYWDMDEDKQCKTEITKAKYKFIKLLLMDVSHDVAFYDISPGFELPQSFNDYPQAHQMTLKEWGMTDYCNIYFFERINDKWFLVGIQGNDGIEP